MCALRLREVLECWGVLVWKQSLLEHEDNDCRVVCMVVVVWCGCAFGFPNRHPKMVVLVRFVLMLMGWLTVWLVNTVGVWCGGLRTG